MAKITKRGGKYKYKYKNDGNKKKNQRKLFLTSSDDNPMFNAKSPGEKYTYTLILLCDKIYDKNVPNVAKGKFFKCKVGKYKINGKKFKMHFMDQAIEPEGANWIEFPSNEEDKIMKKSNWSWLMKAKNSTSRLMAEFRRQNVMPGRQQEKQSKQ